MEPPLKVTYLPLFVLAPTLICCLIVFLPTDKCELKGSLSGSNAGITSIEFDSAVSIFIMPFAWGKNNFH